MSVDQHLTLPWASLDRAALEKAAHLAAHAHGAVATTDPEKVDPDESEGYVRPGFEDVGEEQATDEVTWHFGFSTGRQRPGQRYAWGAVHFAEDADGGVRGFFDSTDYD